MTKQISGETPEPMTDLVQVVDSAPVAVVDPEEAALAIVRRILKAESVEDVLKMASARGADEVMDKPIIVTAVKFQKSAFEQGSPIFGVIRYKELNTETGETPDGDPDVFTCGGSNVMAQLARLQQLVGVSDPNEGTFKQPIPCKLIRAERPTGRGFYPLWLTLADA